MIQIKKKRTFETLVTDTFKYIHEVYRHFLPTMLRVNIFYILSACVMLFLLWSKRDSYHDVWENIETLSTFSIDYGDIWHSMPLYNMALWEALLMSGLMVILVVAGVVFMVYTPTYMILHARYGRVPSYDEIVLYLKSHAARIAVYMMWSLLLFFPVVILSVILGVFLAVSVVGIPLLILYVLMLKILYEMTLYSYLEDDDMGFFKALGMAWGKINNAFLKNMGAYVVVSIISGVAMSAVKMMLNAGDYVFDMNNVFSGIVTVFFYSVLYLMVSVLKNVAVGMIHFSSEYDKKSYFYADTLQKQG